MGILFGGRDEFATRDVVFQYRREVILRRRDYLSGYFLDGVQYTRGEALLKLHQEGFGDQDAREYLAALPKVSYADFVITISDGTPEELATSSRCQQRLLELRTPAQNLCFPR
jgi:hypothetical protein